jgi:hypothetical protein
MARPACRGPPVANSIGGFYLSLTQGTRTLRPAIANRCPRRTVVPGCECRLDMHRDFVRDFATPPQRPERKLPPLFEE